MSIFLQKIQRHISLIILFFIILISSTLFFQEFIFAKKAKIIFLDVGQGDAIFIITPHGRKILIDSGKYDNISFKLAKYMSSFDRTLDLLVATHPDIDHIAGFNSILDEYSVGAFMHSGLLAGAPVYRSIAKKVKKYHISQHALVAGEKIFLDESVYLEVLSPYEDQKIEDANDASVVLLLHYGPYKVLLTGDAPYNIEQNLVNLYGKNLKADILKMGHHGSKNSSGRSFVETVSPKYGIISAACHNSYGHPSARVLRLLDDLAIEEINTCALGDIVFFLEKDGFSLKEK